MRIYIFFMFFLLFSICSYSQSAKKLMENGEKYFKEKKYSEAIQSFSKSLDKDYNEVTLIYRGLAYITIEEFELAKIDLNAAININSNNYFSYELRGTINYFLKDYNSAVEDLSKSIKLNPDNLTAYFYRVNSYEYLNKTNEALQDLSKLIEIEPSAINYYKRGTLYNKLYKLEEAEKDANFISNNYPESNLSKYLFADIYLSRKHYNKAIDLFSEAIKDYGDIDYYYAKLGLTYFYNNQYEKALEIFNSFLKNNSSSQLWFLKGYVNYFGLRNITEANKNFQNVIDIEGDNKTVLSFFCMFFLGNETEAIKNLSLLASKNNDGITYYNLAALHSLNDDEIESINSLNKAFNKGFNDYSTLFNDANFDNIKYKSSFQDLLAKHNIPFSIDNRTLIQSYVKAAVNRWQRRGRYEKREEYLARINQENRNKIIEDFTQEAIQQIGRQKVSLGITITNYNPDEEIFTLKLEKGQNFYLNVPVKEAEFFEKNLNSFEKFPVFSLNNNFEFELKELSFHLPRFNKQYTYSSDNTYSFNSSQLTLNFSPINVSIERFLQNDLDLVEKSTPKIDFEIPITKNSKPNTFALIIGNEDYNKYQPDLQTEANVDWAKNDALIFKELLNKTFGIPENNITLLLNATAGQIRQGLLKLERLSKAYNGDAEIIFYFAGHGLPDETTKESYIIPVDISGSTLEYAIKVNDIYSQLTNFPSKRVVVFLDACFSGGARNIPLLTNRAVRVRPREEIIPENILVLTSSSGTQSSISYDDKGHGLFTYFLLKKMSESEGNIGLLELSNYLQTEVNRKAILLKNREQQPTLLYNNNSNKIIFNSLTD